MNGSSLKSIFSSLAIKVFLGFWIIALTAMGTTRWISLQFIDYNRVEAISVEELRKLDKAAVRIQKLFIRQSDDSIAKIFKSNRHLPRGLWIKSLSKEEVISNTNFRQAFIVDKIQQLKFSQPVKVLMSGYQLTGPIAIDHNNKNYQLFMGKPLTRRDLAGLLQQMPFWLRLLTTLAITGILSWVLSWYLIRPLKTLTQASKKFGKGELSTRLPEFEKRFDEVGKLGQAFNGMADRLQNSISAQQRLLGDISHELRSPLTRLQLALTLAERLQNNNPELDKYLNRFSIEINRLDLMIGQALQLSRLENQLQQLHFSQFDLSKLVANIVTDARFLSQQKNITITTTITTDISFTGDQQLLSSAIENILNNAIRYSPNDAEIELTLAKSAQQISIEVKDQGPGVEQQFIDDIFKPFFRTSEARDRISGGTGLGLAIASRAINCHHGHIYAKLATNKKENPGLVVNITLPISSCEQ